MDTALVNLFIEQAPIWIMCIAVMLHEIFN